MRFAIEFSADAERDFDLIFDHLFESYVAFGEDTEEALDHAAQRIMGIRQTVDRLASFPLRGTARDDILPRIRILAVIFGGQDHIRHMLTRLLGGSETPSHVPVSSPSGTGRIMDQ